jgi:hypothetical protein
MQGNIKENESLFDFMVVASVAAVTLTGYAITMGLEGIVVQKKYLGDVGFTPGDMPLRMKQY